ncbi:LamG-like jellyroll fold domain-containing protein [Kitasatospora sp. MAP5-34]|uniref:LamG-like jellyroll fold domain-containing protein n=1 Tax=Kitasatospora sp. MAP5-34 TaxID=3035102 RepID=UPI002474FC32|nr:LamG-like jellyroll fold domain-containing protein [Kitasatospora sp. MAP5-34]MDH6578421.1 hypothetical protein [Kitasatospora sp. MAP5-34]
MSTSPPGRRHRAIRGVSAAATLAVVLTGAAVLPAHAAVTAAPHAVSPPADSPLSLSQAQVRAASSNQDVLATAATTDTETLTAHPNGTFTIAQSLAPVRKRVNGTWADLDPNLHKNPDGTISPAVTSSSLTLSGGGKGPLATMAAPGGKLAVSLPVDLPAPTLSGPTAMYANVLDGVDLKVTTDSRGTFSEVLIVKNAKAAANPALKQLRLATKTDGVTLSADKGGNITAKDRLGRAVFTAPAPQMWDSAAAGVTAQAQTKTVKDPRTGQAVNARTGNSVNSSEAGPGESAHLARIATKVDGGGIDLTPDPSLLTGPITSYPLYIDPTFYAPSASSSRQGWAWIGSAFPNQAFYDTSDQLKMGDNTWQAPYYVARSYMQISVDPSSYDSQVISSQLNFTGAWSADCTQTNTELWLTPAGSTIGNGTTWSNSPQPQTYIASDNKVFWGTSLPCARQGVGFDITGVMGNAASQHTSSLLFVLKAQDESNSDSWKRYENTVSVSTTYDHAPDRSTGLYTSPATSCGGGTYAGDGDVWLYAGVSDRDGGTLGATFHVWKDGTGTTIVPDSDPNQLTAQSGSTLAFKLPKSTLEAIAGNQLLKIDWTVTTTDFYLSGPTSTTCTFTFDNSRPGAPTVALPANGNNLGTVGTAVSLAISPQCGSTCPAGSIPSSYQYQLNGGAPLTVTASATGTASITVTPTRRTNLLSVVSMSPSGNMGQQSFGGYFNSKAAAPAADGDLTGDGQPDLLTVGGKNGLPSGLWLGRGRGDAAARAISAANNIGAYGNGYNGDNLPSDFDGAQAVVGHFTDNNFQDVLAYYPATGRASILEGSGDGSPIQAQLNGNQINVTKDTLADINGNKPIQLAAAGSATNGPSSYADLIGTSGNTAQGFTLDFYQAQGTAANYVPMATNTINSPDGKPDWDQWTIATCQLPTAAGPRTAMYLWNQSSGELDLWTNLNLDATGTLNYTSFQMSTNWSKDPSLSLQAADIDGNGNPDLWTVGSGGAVTAYLSPVDLTKSTTFAKGTDTLVAPTHAWVLNSGTSGAITTATDTAGGQPLGTTVTTVTTPPTGPVWNTGDMFDPDARFDTKGALVSAAGQSAITPTADFSVSAWVKADTLSTGGASGSVVLSQDGSKASSFALWADSQDKTWRFQMPQSDTATPAQDVVTSGNTPAQVGVWTHLTATYQVSTGLQTLYVNGVPVGTGTHAKAAWATNGSFSVGSYLYNGGRSLLFNGQIANVQTWQQALTSSQVGALVDLPPSPSELQLTTLDSTGNLDHTVRAINGTFTPWDAVPDMAYVPMGTNSATQAEYQGTTYIAKMSSALEFQVRPFGSSTWGSPTGTSAPLPSTVGSTTVSITAVDASAIVNGDFDLIGTGSDGHLYEALRHPNGVWVSWSDLTAQISAAGIGGSLGTVQEVAAATTTGGDLQVLVIAGGKLYHAVRGAAGGTWSGWGDVYANSSNPGTPNHVSAAGVAGALQVMVSTNNGSGLYHSIRDTTGHWGAFGDVEAATATNPGTVVSIGMSCVGTGASSMMQVAIVNSAGTIYHTIRYPSASWATMGNVTSYVQGTLYGTPKTITVAGD